jgi:hypothetical protein
MLILRSNNRQWAFGIAGLIMGYWLHRPHFCKLRVAESHAKSGALRPGRALGSPIDSESLDLEIARHRECRSLRVTQN